MFMLVLNLSVNRTKSRKKVFFLSLLFFKTQKVTMAERSKAPPQFGEWDNGGNTEYTDYFERASKGRNGGKGNPNEIREHKAQGGPITPKAPLSDSPLKSRIEDRPSREEGRRNDLVGRKSGTVDSPNHPHRHGGVSSSNVDGPKRATRTNTGSDRSIEQSPLHHQQPRMGNRGGGGGVSSPSWERKASSAESSGHGGQRPTTPGRSRLGSVTRGAENLDDGGATVPKFGDWDESDPTSAEGFTQVFERVRDEKNSAGKAPLTPTSSSNGQKRSMGSEPSEGCCCFPWGRK